VVIIFVEVLWGQSIINEIMTLNIMSNNIINLEIMQAGEVSADKT
jgi:hypothetical protein